jgi:hypothetical protein
MLIAYLYNKIPSPDQLFFRPLGILESDSQVAGPVAGEAANAEHNILHQVQVGPDARGNSKFCQNQVGHPVDEV